MDETGWQGVMEGGRSQTPRARAGSSKQLVSLRHPQDRESASGCSRCPPGPLSTEPGVRQNLFTGFCHAGEWLWVPVPSSFP